MENSNSLSARKDVLFTATDVARILNISRNNDIIPFLELKKFLVRQNDHRNRKGNLIATALGVQSGCLVNQVYGKFNRVQFFITEKGMKRIENAFCHNELTPEQQKRVNAICMEAEKTMRPTGLGLAE